MKAKNLPAISNPAAMKKFSNARNNERDALLGLINLKEGLSILDLQSSSGYLSDEIYRRLNKKVSCFCLEPTKELRERLNPDYIAIDNPVENFYSLANESMDIVLGLAGLHHSESHSQTIQECFRVLKPDGQLAICDVIEGSSLDRWLNGFVNGHSASGHQGNFIKEHVLAAQLRESGFENIYEEIIAVPWVFQHHHHIAEFFKGLFGLSCSIEDINKALDDYFIIEKVGDQLQLQWELLYCTAKKH